MRRRDISGIGGNSIQPDCVVCCALPTGAPQFAQASQPESTGLPHQGQVELAVGICGARVMVVRSTTRIGGQCPPYARRSSVGRALTATLFCLLPSDYSSLMML